ncbi:hypothetical protein L2E82_34555 [Cichorium intybus]|uniref:Uncharacterized protein n=1 Tax=Cichorium intybus TaxID=13427 RepID=A0ACB9BME4_CICIN|nr:hypothetical protein L2E82_34555 [Cichorium intybus]
MYLNRLLKPIKHEFMLIVTDIEVQWTVQTRPGLGPTCSYQILYLFGIPYPFGIGRHCSWDEWFNVDCNSSTPYLPALHNVELLDVSLDPETIIVNFPMISDCENPVQKNNFNLSRSPFLFSGFDNLFVVKGCGNAAIMDENGTITCGDQTISDVNNCFGIGCCQTMFLHDVESFTMNLTGLETRAVNGSCGSA